ncbi:phage protease [Komagataeibacter kakiaceti]
MRWITSPIAGSARFLIMTHRENVTLIRRAALTNDPNLLDLHTLHHRQETRMDLAELARRLGLPDTATQADVDRALEAARTASAATTSLHSSLGTLVGLGADAGTDAILAAVRASVEGGQANTSACRRWKRS